MKKFTFGLIIGLSAVKIAKSQVTKDVISRLTQRQVEKSSHWLANEIIGMLFDSGATEEELREFVKIVGRFEAKVKK